MVVGCKFITIFALPTSLEKMLTKTYQRIKSPLNYIGGKTKILNQILPLFPKYINNFVDIFAGGCNVGINVEANKVYFNDNLSFLIEMYRYFQQNELESTLSYIQNRIATLGLSLTNEEAYKKLRNTYNQHKHPLDLFVLIAYSFNHQIRFNNNHQFNNPFGKNRSSFNPSMKHNLEQFIIQIKETQPIFSSLCFTDFDYSFLTQDDFLYADPPYLITTGTYNDGKRGFKGWNEKTEHQLLTLLDQLNARGIKFALSNVLEHKGKENTILKSWLSTRPHYVVNHINTHYANANYQTLVRNKNASNEVLITNYISKKSF